MPPLWCVCVGKGGVGGGGGGGGGGLGNVQNMVLVSLPMINQGPSAAPDTVEGGCQSIIGESGQGFVISADILPS